MKHSWIRSLSVLTLFALTAAVGCETPPRSQARRASLMDDAQPTVRRFEREDPGLRDFMANAYGYAVFPEIGKGGIIVGGAYGKGVVYQQNRAVGYADMTQASVGAQLGGQTYAELIVFQTPAALDRFKNNALTFAANASAVAIKTGAAAAAKYEDGVAVFTMPRRGLMAEASIGGQKFTFVTLNEAERRETATTMP